MCEMNEASKMRGRYEKRTQNFSGKLKETDHFKCRRKQDDNIKTRLTEIPYEDVI
jgi:hypothetical protein